MTHSESLVPYPAYIGTLGSGVHVDLPEYLLKNKGLFSLVKNKEEKPCDDKKCFFRFLAINQGAKANNFERKTNKLVKYFCKKFCIIEFEGATID